MKYRFLVIASFGALLISDPALAQALAPDDSTNELLELIRLTANSWSDTLREYAERVFWALAKITLVLHVGMPLLFRQAEIADIIHELVKFSIVTGIFAAALMWSVEGSMIIVQSFQEAASAAAGTEDTIRPGDIIAMSVQFSAAVLEGMHWSDVGLSLLLAIAAILVMLCFSFIGIFMFLVMVECYIVINAAVLFMGLGGSPWTRDYAIAPIKYAVAVGAKLFVLILIAAVIVGAADQWRTLYDGSRVGTLTLMGLALLCAYLTKTIPDVIQGLIMGTSPGTGSAVGGMAALGLAAASAGAGAVAGAAASAGSAATGGNSLQSALGASFAGGGNMAGAAPGAASLGSGGSGADSVASTLAPRAGGAPNPGPSAPSGPSSSASTAGGGTTSVSGQAAQPGSGQAPAQPKQSGGLQASEAGSHSTNAGNPISTAMAVVDAATRAAGVLGSMAVPGMEGAPGIPPSSPASMSSMSADADEGSPSQGEAPDENTIRPASMSLSETRIPGMAEPENPARAGSPTSAGEQPPQERT